jgi:hypothetical protein
MEFRNRWSLLTRLLTGALGISCIVGALLGLLNGYYLLAFSQVLFAAAMFMILFGAQTKRTVYFYLVWACLGAGILLTAVASMS